MCTHFSQILVKCGYSSLILLVVKKKKIEINMLLKESNQGQFPSYALIQIIM